MKSYIKSIGTALPAFCTSQLEIVDFMASAVNMNEEEKLKLHQLYRASGIGKRYSVIPDFGLSYENYTFFPKSPQLEPFPTIGERMKLYEKEALPLAIKAIENCFQNNPSSNYSDITHLITVSCTGMYAPGLDIEIISALNLSSTTQRTCINFMGCYAAFNGLKAADYICKSESNAKVLLVCIELCTLHYQKSKEPDHLLSNAIFSDGAAAVLIDNKTPKENETALSIENFHSDLEPEGKSEMAWHIRDFGFEMVLSSYVPELLKGGIQKLTAKLFEKVNLKTTDIDFYAIHPGGKKILDVVESVLKIDKEKNKYAHQVLREYGNMSSPTVLFVLKKIIENSTNFNHQNNILSFAFGPGLTLESMLLKIHSLKEYHQEKLTIESETISL